MSYSRPRVVFLGTPEAAVPILDELLGVADVVAVLTRGDRPRGRSGRPQPSPVKEAALARRLRVIEAGTASEIRASQLTKLDVDLGVVAAFGVIIPGDVLAVPGHGYVNVHFSLLPRWRGASPVAAAIAAGDQETGVSIMVLDEGLDTGPVLASFPVVIGPEETAGDLTNRLSKAGASLLSETIPIYLQGRLTPVPQDDTNATLAPRLGAADRRLDLRQDPDLTARRIRALTPRPGAFLMIDGQRLGVTAARPSAEPLQTGVFKVEEDRLLVGSAGLALDLLSVQPAGRRQMSGRDWARGWRTPPAVDL